MSTLTLENEASVAGQIISLLSGGMFVSPPEDLSIEVRVPNFGGFFRLEITELDDSEIEAGRVLVNAAIDANASLLVTLFGESDSGGFHTKSVSFKFETAEKTAESDFRLATLRAALSLATQTRLVAPGLSLDLWFRLNESLRDVGELLKLRQTMYRLMTIERATGTRFKIPSFIEGRDMEAISFLYHAITERAFGWPFEGVLTVYYPASQALADRLAALTQSSNFAYPCFHHKSLLGIEFPLGEGAITIIDKHIEDSEQVLSELRKDDGRIVTVRVRSRIGLAHYNFPGSPRMMDQPWDGDLAMLISMEEELDAALMQRYHALAGASLAGLSEDEKAAVTARPEIGEAFLIEDASAENI
jgi:hypothetical protein